MKDDLIERLEADDLLPADMEFLVEEAAQALRELQKKVDAGLHDHNDPVHFTVLDDRGDVDEVTLWPQYIVTRGYTEIRAAILLPCGDGYVTWLPVFTNWFPDPEQQTRSTRRTARQNWIEGYRWAMLESQQNLSIPGLQEEAENEWQRRQAQTR